MKPLNVLNLNMQNPEQIIPKPLSRVAKFEKLGYGMFLHWGLYSQLGAGEWIMLHGKLQAEEYNKLHATFTASNFNALAWARLARGAGMR